MKRAGRTVFFGMALLVTVTSTAQDVDEFQRTFRELMEADAQLRDEGRNEEANALRERVRRIVREARELQAPPRRRATSAQERVERMRQQIRELEVAAELIAAEGNQQRAEEMLARALELKEELEQDVPRERRERERPLPEVDLPREINKAIDKLREHGNTEIAMALQRRVVDMLRELQRRDSSRDREPARDVLQDRRRVPVNPDVSHALGQLRRDLNDLRENPRAHPEVGHVIRDLRAQVQQLREELSELREAFLLR